MKHTAQVLVLSCLIGFGFTAIQQPEFPTHFPKPVYDFSTNPITDAGFKLGRKLFYDPILSRDYFVSCGSCHQQFAAFSHIDHALAHGIYGKIGIRNVPALQNLIWNKSFMADGGINHIEVQPLAPITNSIEMDLTLPEALDRLRKDSSYPNLFVKAFGDTLINTARVLKALTQFMGSMISADAKYDRMLKGKETFTDAENRGLKLFRKKCVACHAEPLLTNNGFASIGLPFDTALKDSGRYKITGIKTDFNVFRVPTLRNAERTYPYMHDGRFRTLKEAVAFYQQEAPATADPRRKRFKLTPSETDDLVAFILTLTDNTFLYDRRFSEEMSK